MVTLEDAVFLTDGTPCLVAGVTGAGARYGGKTATAHWWSASLVEAGRYDYAIAFSPKPGNYSTFRRADGWREAADAIADGADRVSIVPPDGSWDDLEDEHADAFRFAEGLSGSAVFVHDDAILYSSASSLRRATAIAGNPGRGSDAIKSIVVSQDPWDLPRKGVRSNLPVVVWVGPVTDEAEAYFRQVRGSRVAEVLRSRHDEPHVWTAIDGEDLYTFDPVEEGWS